jgi:enterochelin esterase-like enzyme
VTAELAATGWDAISELTVHSHQLGEQVRALVLRPDPPAAQPRWLYLLHGRGSAAAELVPALAAVRDAVRSGALPAHVVVAPDAPWSNRASFWLDSRYAGDPAGGVAAGRPVESAMLADLVPAVEDRIGPPSGRARRAVGGISMGGGAALRWALTRPALFGAAVLLSPAVYAGLPPDGSSMRAFGAFGSAADRFDAGRYRELTYPALLSGRSPASAPLRVAILVGDREPPVAAGPAVRDLDLEAARLHAALKRQPSVHTALRVRAGGHDWSFWRPALLDGLAIVTAESSSDSRPSPGG